MFFDNDEQNKYIRINDLNFDEAELFDQFCALANEFALKKKRNIKCNNEKFHKICELCRGLVSELAHFNVNVTANIDATVGTGTVIVNGNEIVFNDTLQFLKLIKLAECCEIEKKVDDTIDMNLTVWGLYEYI